MKIHKIQLTALALALPGLVWAQPDAQKACDALTGQASVILGSQPFACSAGTDGTLSVTASPAAFEQVRTAAFPADTFQTYPVVRGSAGASSQRTAAVYTYSAAPQQRLADLAAPASFDGASAHTGGFVLAQFGPPGSGTPPGAGGPPGSRPAGGPPGSGFGGPPGSGSAGGPPGSGFGAPGGNDAPPPGSTPPPSRPTPVFTPRAPAPNYWNTVDWNSVTYWDSLPYGWDNDQYDNDQGVFRSRWYPYGRTFVTPAGMTTDRESVTRNFSNQNQDIQIRLRSTEVADVKTCYYQAIYNYQWNAHEGEWDGEFQYYRAACVRSQQNGNSVDRTVVARFNMGGKALLPWETEQVSAAFDGNNVNMDVGSPAFQYAKSSEGDTFTFAAGAKLLTPPDVNGVNAVLVNDRGALKLHVTDKWAGRYAGETLELSVKVMRVNPSWNPFASNFEVLNATWKNGTQIRWSPAAPPGVNDASFDIPVPDQGSGKYYVDSWAFRRVNNSNPNNQSRFSLNTEVYKGRGERVSK